MWVRTYILFLIFSLFRDNIIILAPAFVFVTFPIYWQKTDYKQLLKEYGLIVKDKLPIILYGILGFFCIVFLVMCISLIFYFFELNDQQNIKDVVKSLPLIAIPFAVLFAPFAEEVFFRGFLYKKFGVWVSALIFALLHFAYGSIVEITVAFVIAIFLTYLFIKTKSLWPAIIAHSLFNLMSLTVMWLL